MLFNSVEFLIFFPLTTILYYLLPHKYRWIHLLVASWIFYSFFIPVYSLILLATIVIDYFAAISIYRSQGRKKKFFLLLSIIANVGILCYFKYYNFFLENINEVLRFNGIAQIGSYLSFALPIGLSFHTFQAMSYTIEVYRGRQLPEKHFGIYALYVMFYPQLVAGPIERPQNLLHQFHERHVFNKNNCIDGLKLMLWGFFKKMVVADNCSLIVNNIFNHYTHYSFITLIFGSILFAIQIYCDFSGYSGIAIGSAKAMGFNLRPNFAYPYFSRNIAEFWRRWHISLSTWFRDYIYIPLGGSKSKNVFKKVRNIIIIFFVSALWHGANWTFIFWGFLNALYFLPLLLSKRNRVYLNTVAEHDSAPSFTELFQILLTFAVTSFAFIFFRSPNVGTAFNYIAAIFTLKPGLHLDIKTILPTIIISVLMFFVEWKSRKQQIQKIFEPANDVLRWASYITITILILILSPGEKAMFIYFQF